jgi:tRNA G46 methylase TrmB
MIFENNIFTSNSKNLENYKTEPSWWIETRYQKKAKELGNKIYFMEFTKV